MTDTAEPPAADDTSTAKTTNLTTRKPGYSFEEFRMMYESTECVSDRKINFMRNNSQLCVAIIAGQGVAAGWAYNKPIEWVMAITVLVIGILGLFFCRYWTAQLETFLSLNAAKFTVLEEMADHVVFPDYQNPGIRSKNPFFREYEIMEQRKKLIEKETGQLAPKSSEAEKIVPQCFVVFFGLSIVLSLYWLGGELREAFT
jgi:hypothetical protein